MIDPLLRQVNLESIHMVLSDPFSMGFRLGLADHSHVKCAFPVMLESSSARPLHLGDPGVEAGVNLWDGQWFGDADGGHDLSMTSNSWI